MLYNTIKCCHKCVDERSPTCHATCEKYAREKAKHDRDKQERLAQNKVIGDYLAARHNAAIKKKLHYERKKK